MADMRSFEECCKRHFDADLKSRRLEVTFQNVLYFELTNEEYDCLYACNGYNHECPRYHNQYEYHNQYKEVEICAL